MIYEFITPSDAITFIADNDKIAFIVCLLIGEGKAGCHREDGESLNTMTAFTPESGRKEIYEQYCGTEDVNACFEENIQEVALSLLSFAYGNINDRKQYDDAILAITDPEKLKKFKEKHEDRQRTSLSRWVKYAWNTGNRLIKKHETSS